MKCGEQTIHFDTWVYFQTTFIPSGRDDHIYLDKTKFKYLNQISEIADYFVTDWQQTFN